MDVALDQGCPRPIQPRNDDLFHELTRTLAYLIREVHGGRFGSGFTLVTKGGGGEALRVIVLENAIAIGRNVHVRKRLAWNGSEVTAQRADIQAGSANHVQIRNSPLLAFVDVIGDG